MLFSWSRMLGVMELVSWDSFVALSWGGAEFGRSFKNEKVQLISLFNKATNRVIVTNLFF